jgi:acetate kinase
MSLEKEVNDLRVDVEVLKTQVTTITQLCNKMDVVIEKLISNHEKMTNQIYDDMDEKKKDTNNDIKELHSRISTISRELSDKVELTERRIMEEIKSLRDDISTHNKKEDADLKKLLEWKWMAIGGIVVLSWLFSHVNFDTISKMFG